MQGASRPASRHVRQVADLLQRLARGAPLPGTLAPAAPVVESWQRSFALHGLRPERRLEPEYLPAADLRHRQQGLHRLYRLADGELQRLQRQLNGGDFSLLLADATGRILHRLGEQRLDRAFRRAGLAPGADWSEAHVGTNGIGTTITRREPTLIHADEHFLADNIDLSCAAAPIRAGDGELLAVLDASTLSPTTGRQRRQQTMGLVQMSALGIEHTVFLDQFRHHWIIAFHARAEFLGLLHERLLAVDNNGVIRGLNRTAARHLGSATIDDWLGKSLVMATGQDLDSLLAGRPSTGGTRELPLADSLVTMRLQAPCGNEPVPLQHQPPPSVDALTALLAGPEPALEDQLARLRRLLDRDVPLFLAGETGTGKERLALAIHDSSQRANHPFVALNCAAIPAELIESELFGYQAGAFTGARRDGMPGKLLQANGGTLFLDEIGDMPTALQTRLLRVLETGEVLPLGGALAQRVSFQLLSASHQDLEAAVSDSRFREDLYYRINGFSVQLPPLRERRDLPGLIRRILLEESRHDGRVRLSSPAMDALLHYRWPGNLRQLRHTLRVAVGLCDDGVIRLADLPSRVRNNAPDSTMTSTERLAAEDSPERAELVAALQRQRWNVRRAAADLGISRNTLYRRMHRHGVPLQHGGGT